MSHPDTTPEPIAFGERLRILRTRRGMTRPVLAGLLGKSPSWLKQVERGDLHIPALPMVLRMAEVLRVRDLSDLTGDARVPTALFVGPGHPRLSGVRAAVDAFPLAGDDRPAPEAAHLQARIAHAWSARHSAPNHRDVIGTLLPDLIRDGQLAVRQARTSAERRSAQAALAEVYCLAQFFLAYQPDSALLWRVAERGIVAAQESEDPHALGMAAWLTAEAHRDAGHYDGADAVTMKALRWLEARLPDADDEVRAIAGALEMAAGYTAARRGDTGSAWGWWDKADRAAARLPTDYYHPVTSFSRAVMGAHAVTLAVELHAGNESVRQATRADAGSIPSRPRRARHRIEEARAYQLDGKPETALETLDKAYANAPETIRYNGYARRIILEETEAKAPERRRRASELAVKVGVLAA
ncbi:helix-turn-helix transcriptional regulator [Streptomyces sp. WMMB 322]|uniref:helix-turn-helix domain-containing protein n=1 Tax=Streptomyces sp. WMMB 322 TaxID=1286821 RepID=UPI0006E3A967|nr:helix-turn-helix transcriptional regulator [Streptomyces sp. WMMB 322]SCK12822.1 Helix-turn-helix domain-containing protein [Streptomyces sp. WMMB 322]